MPDRPFAHLHCHSHYSLLDGASRIPELVATVKAQGMNALALTDHGNLYGAVEFYRECKAAGLNPIIGYEAYVAPGKRTEREARRRGEAGYHLTLLAKNAIGLRHLIKMSSAAFLDGYYYIPRIDKELLERHHEGIICLSGCASAEFSEHILAERTGEAEELAQWFHRVFGKDFYIEIQNNGVQVQKLCADGAIDIANRLGLPLVATSDAHYLREEDAPAHDVLLCINTRRTRNDPNRMRFETSQFHIRPPSEMYALFPGQKEAVQRSQEIADGCCIEMEFGKRHFPVFTPPAPKTDEQFLRELCEQGMRERYGPEPPTGVQERLDLELAVISKLGFASYFLIVWDFVRFAIERGIPTSARGSACGAMVSYLLRLSNVDPLEYDLLFERFLDPNRMEAPDIDIDFCQDRREEVIQYVRQKYGTESVAQIGTFGTMAARAAIKDVGRVLEVPLDRVNKLTNFIPRTLGITIDDALKQSPDLRHEYDTDAQIRELIDIARKLEGTNRNAGTHAAGVVIANGPITDYVPVQRVLTKGEDGNRDNAAITTQWEMGDIEKVGMLKMDFLGLRTLTLLDNCVKLIASTRGVQIDLNALPLDDKLTYQLLQRGDARGVFQLESDGIRELLKRMKPDNIRDIIAIMALYRPGPLQGGMVDAYISCKHGREKPAYAHPVMEEVLGETYGVMVYQEQVMRILNRLGGIDLSSAYQCIKAISKKKHDIINERKTEFLKGAKERGVSEAIANDIFEKIVFFGGYGFNKSHSAAYGLIGYQTAYLKSHYTPEFMAALLSSEIEDGNKRDIMVEHFEDARRLDCPVQPPNLNEDLPDFTVQVGRLLFGLVAIKGLGRGAANDIVRARQEQGSFKDIFDFCERVDHQIVSQAAIEKLIQAGAMDCFGARRSQLMQVLPQAIQAAKSLQQDQKVGQLNLFAAFDSDDAGTLASSAAVLPNIPEWPALEKLKYEKEALDFYISSHPLAQYEELIRLFSTYTSKDLAAVDTDREVLIGGMLTQVRLMNTKKARNGNSRYARFKLEDFHGSVECVMWPDDYVRCKDLLVEDRICFASAIVERGRDQPGLVVSKILQPEEVQRQRTTGVVLRLVLGQHEDSLIDAIARILKRSPGNVPVFLTIRDTFGRPAMLKASSEFCVNPNNLAKAEIETILGQQSVVFSRHGNGNGR
jgi:DNA polymerase-3 subunit alpha